MAEYVKSLIIIGVAASLALTALPRSAENSGKYVRQLSSFLILAVMLSPLAGLAEFARSLKSGIDGMDIPRETRESEYNAETVIGESAEVICKYIIRLCAEKYGFDEDETTVRLILDERDVENVIIDEIQVYTRENDSGLLEAASAYLSETFCCKAFVFGGAASGEEVTEVSENSRKERE